MSMGRCWGQIQNFRFWYSSVMSGICFPVRLHATHAGSFCRVEVMAILQVSPFSFHSIIHFFEFRSRPLPLIPLELDVALLYGPAGAALLL